MGGGASETSDEKAVDIIPVLRAVRDVDTAAELASGEHGVLDPEEALRVRFVASVLQFRVVADTYVDARSTNISFR